MHAMRFVIFGAGAVGGVVGGRLAQHGHDILLIARGRQIDAIRAHGLQIESAESVARVEASGWTVPNADFN